MDCCCFSSSDSAPQPPTAKVIGLDGSLSEHRVPVAVSKVLGIDRLSCFLCSADSIRADARFAPLDLCEPLETDRIYFVVPKDRLEHRLTGADLAALAVKASSALPACSSNEKRRRRRRKKKSQVGVAALAVCESGRDDGVEPLVRSRPAIRRSCSSRWARAVRRSFRRVLSTIDEDDEDDE